MVWGKAGTHHSAATHKQAGVTPALEGKPPDCTRPWLEENARSRAGVGTAGCCRIVQHPNTTNVPAQLGLQTLCPVTSAVLQKPDCIHNTCPLVRSRGSEAAAPTPCMPPSGTSTVTSVQGNLCYLTMHSTKPR